jgi:hypothetical protein
MSSSYFSKKIKNNVIKNIDTELGKKNSSIQEIIKLRESLNKAVPKSYVKSYYSTTAKRKENTDLQKVYNNKLSKRIKNIDNTIIEKISKSDASELKTVNKKILNIYKKNNERRGKVAKVLKEKGINRDISKDKGYTVGKPSTFRSIIKKSQGALRSMSNSTGLTSYTANRLKRLKGDIQILKKEKEKLQEKEKLGTSTSNNTGRITEINKTIKELKQRIKNTEGINYNETSENYENLMIKTTSKFDLDSEYNKLLLKREFVKNGNKHSINTYKNLLTYNNNKGNNISINDEIFNTIFKKDNLLFEKFTKSVPYSEYNFLYGIDKHSGLAEERLVALLFMTKIIFTFVLEPQFALVTTVAVISLLVSRFALDYYRKYKRSLKKNLIFCTKYFPFGGIEHFSSELISKYHKIFYYDIDENNNIINNTTEKNDKFYESVIELTHEKEKEFIEKNILFIKYLSKYESQLNNNIVDGIMKSFNTNDKKEKLKEIEESLGRQVNKQESESEVEEQKAKDNINEQVKISETEGQEASKKNLVTEIYNTEGYTTNESNITNESNNQKGGGNLLVLVNNRNRINNNGKIIYAKKKTTDKKVTEQFSDINKAIFRLNYKINDKYILTSGDISIQYLFVEIKPIINCRATFFEGELKPFSKSIPFFTNDYLTNLLDKIAVESTKYCTMESTRIYIIDFIKEYIDNFTKLYQLAKYNILLLLKYPDGEYPSNNQNLLLKELFHVNLSYTFKGRYSAFITSYKKHELKDIKYRDILNYYCVLLKYCQVALDHMQKKFKITIETFDKEKYERYTESEQKLNNFFSKKLSIEYKKTNKNKNKNKKVDSYSDRIGKMFGFATKSQLNPYNNEPNKYLQIGRVANLQTLPSIRQR